MRESELSDAETVALFETYHRTRRRRDRNRLVEAHIGFAHYLANRYRNRGVATEDLRQIALLALVKAVDRFDPSNGAAFTTFAGRTIEGEIKRHFRDATWAVRVPRSAKELHLSVRRANDELVQRLDRSPSVDEIAEHLEIDRDDVVRGLAASAAFTTSSLDPMHTPDDDGVAPGRTATLSSTDELLAGTVDRVLLENLLAGLDERDRTIIELRYFDELSQSEIADRVGVSQMHVSRLLRRALESMRSQVSAEVGSP